MSHPVPPPPGPYDGSGQNGQQPQAPAYGGPPAPQSPYGAGQDSGDMNYGQNPPPKKKWPLWVGLGCGCLILLLLLVGGGIFAATQLGGGEEPDGRETTSAEETTDEETTDEETTEEVTTEEETTEEETTEAEGDVSAADQDAAKGRFVDFIGHIANGEYKEACGFVVNPGSLEPYAGAEIDGCVAGLESLSQEDKDSFKAMEIVITVDTVETTPNSDGSLALTVLGEDFPYSMVKFEDNWYVNLAG